MVSSLMVRGRSGALPALLAAVLGAGCCIQKIQAAENPADDPAAWVQRLSDDDFDVRAAAAEKLASLGEAARAALEAAARSADVEARMGAGKLLGLLRRSELLFQLIDRAGKPLPDIEMNLEVYDSGDRFGNSNQQSRHVVTDAAGNGRVTGLIPGQYSVNATMVKCWPASESYSNNANGGTFYQSVQLRGALFPKLITASRGGAVRGKILDPDGKPLKDATLELFHCAYFNSQMLLSDSTPLNQNRQSAGTGTSGADGTVLLETVGDGVYHVVATMSGRAPALGPLVRIHEGQTSELGPLTLLARPDGKYAMVLKGVPLSAEELAESNSDGVYKNKRAEIERTKNMLKTAETGLEKIAAEVKAREEAAKKAAAEPKAGGAAETKLEAAAKKAAEMKLATEAARKKSLEAATVRYRDRLKTLDKEVADILADKSKADAAPKDPAAPALLKHAKIFLETDFIFEGPDAEQHNRFSMIQKSQRMRWNRSPQIETGDEGKLETENLRPGKYRVRLKAEHYAPRTLEVTIAPGAAANLGEIVLDHGGSVGGKALGDKDQSVSDLLFYPIPEDPLTVSEMPQELLGYIQGTNSWEEARNYMNWQRQYDGNAHYADPKNPEKFLLRNLAPGTYSLLIASLSNNRFEQTFLVCGVKVEAGKTTELEPLKFTTSPASAARIDNQVIKGKVSGGGAEGYGRGIVYYQYGGGTSSTSVNSDGAFSIYSGGATPGGSLRVKIPGYKMAELDCTKPGIDYSNIEIKLEKIKYGKLRVKVLDEQGHPLAGASVDPAPNSQNAMNYNYYNRQQARRAEDTNAQGEAFFNGLSTGTRTIQVNKEGYFHTEPIQAVVQGEGESLASVTLRRGYTIRGQVLPVPGRELDSSRTVVSAQGKKSNWQLSVPANAAGEFEFSGMLPDKYALHADSVLAQSLGGEVADLSNGSAEKIKLELQAQGGAALQLDPRVKGCAVTLIDRLVHEKRASNDPVSGYVGRQRPGVSSYADENGRVEFWGVLAGEYYVSIQNRQFNGYEQFGDGEADAGYLRKLKCDQYAGPFKLEPAPKYAAMLGEKPLHIELPQPSASATVRFEFTEPSVQETTTAQGYQQRSFYVLIAGDSSHCQYAPTARRRTANSNRTGLRVQIVGSKPEYLQPLDGGKTLIQDLLPGKYRIMSYSYNYSNMTGLQMQSPQQQVAEFEVKAGERKDLGMIKITPQKETIVMNAQQNASRAGAVPVEDDMEEAFEP